MSIRKTALAPLLLTMIMAGCGYLQDSPLPLGDNLWVASDDGKLALRFSVISQRVTANENIQAVAEIRNMSQEKITVLRPFGDSYAAESVGMKIWDGERQIRYTGATLTYVIGANAIAVIGPGEVVEDKMELTIDAHKGIEPPGAYALRYDYSYHGQWDTTAAAGNSGISDIWRGTISSREVQVFRE